MRNGPSRRRSRSSGSTSTSEKGRDAAGEVRPRTAALAPVAAAEAPVLTFTVRLRKFFWLSSGLFSAAAFAVPAIGALVYGTFEGGGTSFLAAVLSACLFGVTTLLHFGPDEA